MGYGEGGADVFSLVPFHSPALMMTWITMTLLFTWTARATSAPKKFQGHNTKDTSGNRLLFSYSISVSEQLFTSINTMHKCNQKQAYPILSLAWKNITWGLAKKSQRATETHKSLTPCGEPCATEIAWGIQISGSIICLSWQRVSVRVSIQHSCYELCLSRPVCPQSSLEYHELQAVIFLVNVLHPGAAENEHTGL